MQGIENDTVILKNGSEEHSGLVSVTMITLKDLIAKRPIDFYEFVQLCRDPEHKLFGNASEVLRDYALIQIKPIGHIKPPFPNGDNYQVHDSVRNIVLSAVEGDGAEMKLTNPIKP